MMGNSEGRRRGYTVVEVLLGLTLGAAVLVFSMEAFRFFTTRTAQSTEELQRARELGFFMDRLRRVLRFAVKIIPTADGFVVFFKELADDGTVSLREALFRVDEDGNLVVVDLDRDRTYRYEVAGGDRRLGLHAEEGTDPGSVRVQVLGLEDLMGEGGTLVNSLEAGGRHIVEAEGFDPAELADAEAARSWVTAGQVTGDSPADTAGADFAQAAYLSLDPAGLDSEVPVPSLAYLSSLDLEADTLAAELRASGRIFLPAVLPPNLPRSNLGRLVRGLRDAGYALPDAVKIGTTIRVWEEALLNGDRRGAAKAAVLADALLRRSGHDPATAIQMMGSVSRTAAALIDANPDAIAAVERGDEDVDGRTGTPPEMRVPASLVDADGPTLPGNVNGIGVGEVDGDGGVGGDPAAGADGTLDGTEAGPDASLPPIDIEDEVADVASSVAGEGAAAAGAAQGAADAGDILSQGSQEVTDGSTVSGQVASLPQVMSEAAQASSAAANAARDAADLAAQAAAFLQEGDWPAAQQAATQAAAAAEAAREAAGDAYTASQNAQDYADDIAAADPGGSAAAAASAEIAAAAGAAAAQSAGAVAQIAALQEEIDAAIAAGDVPGLVANRTQVVANAQAAQQRAQEAGQEAVNAHCNYHRRQAAEAAARVPPETYDVPPICG